MDTVLFVNATIGFSENLFLVYDVKRTTKIDGMGPYKSMQFLIIRDIIAFACSTNMSKQCKNKQYFTCLLNGLFHKITKWGMNLSDKTTEKLLQPSK